MVDLAQLRICFLAGTLGQGGAERQLFYILKTLRLCGATPHLLCLTQGEFWESRIRDLNIPITWVGRRQSRMARLGAVLLFLRHCRPDIIQSQHFYTNLYATAAARALGLREVGAVRHDAVREAKALGVLGELSLSAPRTVAANSTAAIENAVQRGLPSGRFHLLPNVVDTGRFKPVTPRQNGTVRLLAVGRLIKRKRMDRFLSILARVHKESGQAIKGVVVGDGPLREHLEHQAAKMGLLPGVVEFKGSVADVRSIYRQGDIFVLTSESEGTPNVVLEAMASGLPVVTTRVGGVPEIVQHAETGYVIDSGSDDSGSDDAMVAALLQLSHEPQLRTAMAVRARRYVEDHHALERLPVFLHNLYEAALS